MPLDLSPLLNHLPSWLMVLFRLTGLFVLAPVLGSTVVPRSVRVFLALGLSFCVYPMLLDPQQPSAPLVGSLLVESLQLWHLIGVVAQELLIGFVIGYAVSLPLMGMQMGGQMIDQQLGIAYGGVVNPDLDEESGVTGQILFVLAVTLFVVVGGLEAILSILLGSFDRIPIGGFAQDPGFEALLALVIGVLSLTFDMAIRIAAPMLCLMFLLMTGMGFIGRTVPQINIFAVGFMIRILAGLMILVLGIGVMVGVFEGTLLIVLRRLMAFFAYLT